MCIAQVCSGGRGPGPGRSLGAMTTDATATSQGFADVNGARLWYETAGSGPALVMLHGHLLDSGQWDGQLAELAGERRAVRYDTRGVGRSDMPAPPCSDADGLHALLAVLWVRRGALL